MRARASLLWAVLLLAPGLALADEAPVERPLLVTVGDLPISAPLDVELEGALLVEVIPE